MLYSCNMIGLSTVGQPILLRQTNLWHLFLSCLPDQLAPDPGKYTGTV